ncbi:MAG: glycoside hydrolase [Acidobacteria bacterium]|nr:glycoside hydrolase [Acidobacteriota bacterium]
MKNIFVSVLVLTLATAAFSRTITVDFDAVKGPTDRFYNLTVGAGRAAEGLRADWQRDLAVVRQECGFRYLRFHGLLHDELGVYREDKAGRAVYNFQYIDAVYDAILRTGMKPFVELGFMPDALKSNDKTIFWWKGNIAPPKDYDKWSRLVEALVRHWTARYGEAEVKTWYFEIWNEPNLDFFFTGTQADYFRLFETTARAVKRVSPDYRVGGPATAGRAWIKETIDFASKNKVPLDFITTHDYGVEGRGFDENGSQKLFLDTRPGAIIDGVRDVRAQIKASAMPALPLHYTEWSTSYSQVDPVHDSYLSAAYIVSRLKGAEGFADSMSYWTFTDIFEEGGPVPNAFHGGFGLINFQGLRKPSFYAYQFLNRLGDEELVASDPSSTATRSRNGAQVLLWNYTPPSTTESDQVYFKKDQPTRDAGRVAVEVRHLPPGEYRLKVYRVGYGVNDVYTDYLKMGAPPTLTREQVRALADRNDGRPIRTLELRIRPKQTFAETLDLRENDVYLLTIEKK